MSVEELVSVWSQLGGGGDYVCGIYGECTHLDEAVSNTNSSEDHLAPGMVGQGWSGALGDLLLNLSTIIATSLCLYVICSRVFPRPDIQLIGGT